MRTGQRGAAGGQDHIFECNQVGATSGRVRVFALVLPAVLSLAHTHTLILTRLIQLEKFATIRI